MFNLKYFVWIKFENLRIKNKLKKDKIYIENVLEKLNMKNKKDEM